ncbi:hypothetical protein [Veronia nyctiphanis]|nr:hypothetical protein [Veronia nyctiphanis]
MKPDIVILDDISIIKKNARKWVVSNNTPFNVNSVLLQVTTKKGQKKIIRFNLDSVLRPFAKAVIKTRKIKFGSDPMVIKQNKIFTPRLSVGPTIEIDEVDCIPPAGQVAKKKCIRPLTADYREVAEILTANAHNAANSKQYTSSIRSYFENGCPTLNNSDNCKTEWVDGLDAGLYNMIRFGYEGHLLKVKSIYAGKGNFQGLGGGKKPSMMDETSGTKGFASVREKLYKNSVDGISNGLYKVLLHEYGHAFGYSHKTGMSYGFPMTPFINVITDHNADHQSRPDLQIPDVIVVSETATNSYGNTEAKLSFFDTSGQSQKKEIELDFVSICNQSFDYQLILDTQIGGVTGVDLTFQEDLSCPLHIRVSYSDGKNIATYKLLGHEEMFYD